MVDEKEKQLNMGNSGLLYLDPTSDGLGGGFALPLNEASREEAGCHGDVKSRSRDKAKPRGRHR